MEFRKAVPADLVAVSAIYDRIHTREEQGTPTVGWVRHVYPTAATAEAALQRDDLFVATENGAIVGSAIINRLQPDSYGGGAWQYPAPDEAVMVLHTLTIDPDFGGRGLGSRFVKFYEDYALSRNSPYLRMDTQAINLPARSLYQKLGYAEIDIVPCTFNGIEGVQLVLLEKKL